MHFNSGFRDHISRVARRLMECIYQSYFEFQHLDTIILLHYFRFHLSNFIMAFPLKGKCLQITADAYIKAAFRYHDQKM